MDKLKFDELKSEVVARVKTINWRHPVLIIFLVFVAMELIAPVVFARWGARWGGWGGWSRWGGWGSWGSWGSRGSPWGWGSGWSSWW